MTLRLSEHDSTSFQAEGGVTLWELLSQERAWRKEQEEVRAAIQRHERANTNYYEEGVGILELAQQAYSLYVGASPQNKRDIVRSLLSNCTLNDTTLCSTYRKPYQLLRDALQMKKRGRFLDEYRTFCASPQAEISLAIFEAIPALAA